MKMMFVVEVKLSFFLSNRQAHFLIRLDFRAVGVEIGLSLKQLWCDGFVLRRPTQ